MEWNPTHIDLQNLINLSRGNNAVVVKYLRQFKELIPKRIENLEESLLAEDRPVIRQILHKMSPQLQFFGVKGVSDPIRTLEFDHQSMPLSELQNLVKDIIVKLGFAVKEVDMILDEW